MLHLFKKNEEDSLEYAIKFIKEQKIINKRNIKVLNNLGFETKELYEWNDIYSYIIKNIKQLRKG